MKKITKDSTIGEIVDNYEGSQDILLGYGMHCFGCPMSRMETIEEASAVHGIDYQEVLDKLNANIVEEVVDQANDMAEKTEETSGEDN